jgi:hypothetical protein
VRGVLQRRRMKSRMGKPGGGWRQRSVASGGGGMGMRLQTSANDGSGGTSVCDEMTAMREIQLQ